MKACTRCNEEKSFDSFYRNGKYYHSYCKKCLIEFVKKNPNTLTRKARREQGLSSLEGIRSADREYQRRKRAQNPHMKSEETRRYFEEHPDRAKVYAKTHSALKKGLLIRCPCEVCGSEKAQAHHPDYSQPLTIKWLCASHHKLEHIGSNIT